jgi:hypothetical protein
MSEQIQDNSAKVLSDGEGLRRMFMGPKFGPKFERMMREMERN